MTLAEWRGIERSDEFQTNKYCGGFDSTEDEFCFSYFDSNKVEYWFQKSLNPIEEMISEKVNEFEIRLAE